MQIKRFEADDMTEALRLVKRECGENAVILSAKAVRPGGFFSVLRKKSVEITAATDYPVADTRESNEFSGLLAKHLNSDGDTDRVSLSTPPHPPTPFFRKTSLFSHQPPAAESQPTPTEDRDPIQQQGLIAVEAKAGLAFKRSGMSGEGLMAQRIRDAVHRQLIAEPFYRALTRQKVIALVGPCGVGKTSAVAKLAWRCRMVEKKRTGLISLDRFRFGANGMLTRLAHIMNLPMMIVHDADQLQSALRDLGDVDVLLIDTPGMNSQDPGMVDDVGALLRAAHPDEIHLVASATVRDDVFEATLNTFSHLGVNRLLFTHMDEPIHRAAVFNLLKKSRLPSSFYGDGTDLCDGLQEATADRLAGLPPHREPVGGQVTDFSRKREQVNPGSVPSDDGSHAVHYVANRNSELFHHPNCKSVKRINAANITAFNSIEHAIDEGFKPCRACCDLSMIRKTESGGVDYRHASAL